MFAKFAAAVQDEAHLPVTCPPMERVTRPRALRANVVRHNASAEEFERKRKAFFEKRLREIDEREQDERESKEGKKDEEEGPAAQPVQEISVQPAEEALPRTYRLSRIQSVPTPLFIFDLSHELKGSEVKVLLAVVRQTLGWKAGQGDRRVASAILSQTALKEQTGLATEAISQAVDSLVRRGVVQTHTTKGKPLPTKEERRRLRGPVCFRLAQDWVETHGNTG